MAIGLVVPPLGEVEGQIMHGRALDPQEGLVGRTGPLVTRRIDLVVTHGVPPGLQEIAGADGGRPLVVWPSEDVELLVVTGEPGEPSIGCGLATGCGQSPSEALGRAVGAEVPAAQPSDVNAGSSGGDDQVLGGGTVDPLTEELGRLDLPRADPETVGRRVVGLDHGGHPFVELRHHRRPTG